MTKLVDLPAQTTIADLDVTYRVDVSDTTDDPGGSSKQITHANERTQSDTWLSPTNVAALATLGAVHADGDVVFTKGYTTAGAGGEAEYYLDTSGALGASAENGGTIIATDGPSNSYWRLLGSVDKSDIRRWGGVVDIAAGNETANNLAFSNMIAAKVPVISLPGPICISNTITILDQSITIVGTNPAAPDALAGGLIVTGTGTAQTASIIKIQDNRDHEVKNVRFFGHTSNPSTLCTVGILVTHDTASSPSSGIPTTGTRILSCIFANSTLDTKSVVDCIKIDRVTASGAAEHVLINDCHFHRYTNAGVWINNGQAVQTEMNHCWFDGRGGTLDQFAEYGVLTRGTETYLNGCFFNRLRNCVTIDQAIRVYIDQCAAEKCRTIVETLNSNGHIFITNSRFVLFDDAYTESGTHTGSDNELTVLTDTTKTFVVDEFVGRTIENETDGSSGAITSNTVNTVTCSAGLSGGTDSDWDTNDVYRIILVGSDLRLFNARLKEFVMEKVEIQDSLSLATRPHLYLGTRASTSGAGTITISDCEGLTLDDIDSEVNKGLPSQTTRRIPDNDQGLSFEWRECGSSERMNKFVGSGFFNMD